MRSVRQGRSGFEASQLAMEHVLLGAAQGQDLVQGVSEALEWLLWIVGRHQGVKDLDQALHWPVCPETPHSICRQVVVKLALVGGRQA